MVSSLLPFPSESWGPCQRPFILSAMRFDFEVSGMGPGSSPGKGVGVSAAALAKTRSRGDFGEPAFDVRVGREVELLSFQAVQQKHGGHVRHGEAMVEIGP